MEAFSANFSKETNCMQVTINKGFGHDNIGELGRFYKEQIDHGMLDWEVDLTKTMYIDSMVLGVLVSFNTIVTTHGGRFRLVMLNDSMVAQLIRLTKLDRIIKTIAY